MIAGSIAHIEGLADGDEIDAKTDPTFPDSDGDGMPDGWDVAHGLDPLSAVGADGGSGYPDYDYMLQPLTNSLPPYVVFSDTDGLFDVDETSVRFVGKDKVATVSVHRFTVDEIMFNHDPDACTNDAVSLRKNAREPYDFVHGEWWMGGESIRNDPVCYAGGVIPRVKV